MSESSSLQHTVITRNTEFALPDSSSGLSIQEIYRAIALDRQRNELIVKDLARELEAGRTPLLLTERTDHLKLLAEKLEGIV